MESSTQTVAEQDVNLREPGMFAVIMHNDDITTMDFVVGVLMSVFNKPPEEASAVMMAIHENGRGVAGVYTYDMAATKKSQADRLSAEKGFPLRLTVESERL
ncbi:MAG: ATP-dependent Clp protease adaptor ClpS [Clostridiales bacterium]|jgi:ATP-dependent Clp protease adaptor protein ClpS|nr:ATP-dependent Clp protease adaptor ClpS [Clostridiales bacterium]